MHTHRNCTGKENGYAPHRTEIYILVFNIIDANKR